MIIKDKKIVTQKLEKKPKKDLGKIDISGKGNIAKFFRANPNEVDGLSFQKTIRREWD